MIKLDEILYIYDNEVCCAALLDSLNNAVSLFSLLYMYTLLSFTHCSQLVGIVFLGLQLQDVTRRSKRLNSVFQTE